MTALSSLAGHVGLNDPLNPLQRFDELAALGRTLSRYQPQDLWELDTERLPRALAALRRRVRTFAERELAPLADEIDLLPHWPSGHLPAPLQTLLSRAGRAGLLSNVAPRPLGSAPLAEMRFPTAWRFAIQVEELARVCGGLMLLLSAHHLGAAPLVLAGDLAAVRRFYQPMVRDNQAGIPHLCAYAITEPAAGSDAEDGHGAALAKPGVVARRVAGGWQLRGRKCFISGGDVARTIAVFAALEGEGFESWTCFVVHPDMLGFEVTRTELKMGMRASGAAELAFNDVFVPDSHVVGGLRQGWALNRATLNLSRLPVSAMAVGFARAATERALAFACDTRIGGRPLLDCQEVQLQIAQMIAETRAIRALVWQSARESFRPRQAEASLCKFYATDRAQVVVELAMALMSNHGGLHRHGVEKIWRDVRLTRIFEGTNQINRLSVIEDLQPQLLDQIAGGPANGV